MPRRSIIVRDLKPPCTIYLDATVEHSVKLQSHFNRTASLYYFNTPLGVLPLPTDMLVYAKDERVVVGRLQCDWGTEANDPGEEGPGGGEIEMYHDCDTVLDQAHRDVLVVRGDSITATHMVDLNEMQADTALDLRETEVKSTHARTYVKVKGTDLEPGDMAAFTPFGDIWTVMCVSEHAVEMILPTRQIVGSSINVSPSNTYYKMI